MRFLYAASEYDSERMSVRTCTNVYLTSAIHPFTVYKGAAPQLIYFIQYYFTNRSFCEAVKFFELMEQIYKPVLI